MQNDGRTLLSNQYPLEVRNLHMQMLSVDPRQRPPIEEIIFTVFKQDFFQNIPYKIFNLGFKGFDVNEKYKSAANILNGKAKDSKVSQEFLNVLIAL